MDYLFVGIDILKPKNGFAITVKNDMVVYIPLAQGPLPIPIESSSTSEILTDYGGKTQREKHIMGLISK